MAESLGASTAATPPAHRWLSSRTVCTEAHIFLKQANEGEKNEGEKAVLVITGQLGQALLDILDVREPDEMDIQMTPKLRSAIEMLLGREQYSAIDECHEVVAYLKKIEEILEDDQMDIRAKIQQIGMVHRPLGGDVEEILMRIRDLTEDDKDGFVTVLIEVRKLLRRAKATQEWLQELGHESDAA